MSALPASLNLPFVSAADASRLANAWLLAHYTELRSRARAQFARLDPELRDEMVAETLALTLRWANSAASRGCLQRMTPYWAVCFAARQLGQGRRFSGTRSRCVM